MPFGIARGSREQQHSNQSQQALNVVGAPDSKLSSQHDIHLNSSAAKVSGTSLHPNTSSSDIQAFLIERNERKQHQPHFESPISAVPQNNASRSQIERYPQGQPPQYAPAHDRAFEDEPRPSIRKAAQLVIEHKKAKSRGFFGLGGGPKSKSAEHQLSTSTVSSSLPGSLNSPSSQLGRRISKKSKEQPSVRTSVYQDSSDQKYLSSPSEELPGDLDPYQTRDFDHHSPSNPATNQVNKSPVRALPRDRIPPVDTNVSGQNLQASQYHPSGTPSSQTSHSPGLLQQHHRYNTAKHADQQQANSPHPFAPPPPPPPLVVHLSNSDAVSQLSQDIAVDSDYKSSPIKPPGQTPDFGSKGASPQGELPDRPESLRASSPGAMPMGQNRPTGDGKTSYQTDGREVPPNYKAKLSGHGASLTPAAPGAQSSYRGGPPQRESFSNSGGERGRETPPPAGNQDDAFKELMQKYKKVKGLYFEKTAQVEQLQNTIANQRLSHSRTALDDSEYSTRFNRLDGAVNNLAFNVRKDWKSIPTWLCPFVNQDAHKAGTKEMMAVGRAFISRWLTEEIFQRTFHPGLEPELSANLKMIESNIRKNAPLPNNQEESESLTTKLVHWRMATLDGLSSVLHSPDSAGYKEQFTQTAVTTLTATLMSHMVDPPPAGLEGSAAMIIELAVGITSNLPLESRDIAVIYPLPGEPIKSLYMKVEPALPPLDNPGLELETEASRASSGFKDNLNTDGQSEGVKGGGVSKGKEKPRNSMLAGLMGSKKAQSTTSIDEVAISASTAASREAGRDLVRYAGFVGVEVVGRSMLVKAPVWTIS